MPFYLRTFSGKPQPRVLIDTSKAFLDYEGEDYDLTGATIDCYGRWSVDVGTVGEEGTPAKVLRFEDPFTGLKIEVPLVAEAQVALAAALLASPRPRRRFLSRKDRAEVAP